MTNEEITAALDAAADLVPPATTERPSGPGGRGRRPTFPSWQAAVQAQTVDVDGDGGHQRWEGATGRSGTPVVARAGQVTTVYRLMFRWHHAREPEGHVRPSCSYPRCVAGDHLADRVMRERERGS